MAKNNYLVPFLVFLAIAIILVIVVLFRIGSPAPIDCQTCETCETCPEEKAMVGGVLSSWGENYYDSSEYLVLVDVTNYGYKEAKNVDVTCKIWKADENLVRIQDEPITIHKKSIGNLASTSYKQVEIPIDKDSRWGLYPIAVCYVSSCTDCEILYKRIPELVEGFEA